LPTLGKALDKLKDKDAWELGSRMLEGRGDWSWQPMELLDNHTKTAKGKVLAGFFMDEEKSPLDYSGDWDKENSKHWLDAGVDLIAEEKKREKDAPALTLAKAEPKQKLLLDAPNKAKIIAAQKARWAKVKAAKKK